MKKTVSVLLAGLLATLPLTSMAVDFEDTARVVSVNEKLERVNTPREECTTETIQSSSPPQSSERELGGAVIGGLAGAILGSQVGKGNGKTAGAAVGAVTGALVGGPHPEQRLGQLRWQHADGSALPCHRFVADAVAGV